MTDYITGWQCIGCGRLESPQPCVGICQDRKVQLVSAGEHEEVLRRLSEVTAERDQLAAKLRWIASIHPAAGAHERTVEAFQRAARNVLEGTS